jgi:HPt (histidine-containing phosphotransfer) domain-containing protein
VAGGDLRAVVRTAHTLMGSAANVGAVQVARLAERLVRRAQDGDVDQARQLVDQLDADVARAAAALQADVVTTG